MGLNNASAPRTPPSSGKAFSERALGDVGWHQWDRLPPPEEVWEVSAPAPVDLDLGVRSLVQSARRSTNGFFWWMQQLCLLRASHSSPDETIWINRASSSVARITDADAWMTSPSR